MDYKEITDLIRLVGKSNIADLTIEQGDFRIRLKTLDALQVQSAQVVHGPAVQHAVTTAPAAPALQPAPAPPPPRLLRLHGPLKPLQPQNPLPMNRPMSRCAPPWWVPCTAAPARTKTFT